MDPKQRHETRGDILASVSVVHTLLGFAGNVVEERL